MERAAELLAAAALTVREVAHRVGYRQPAQFAKAFRRHHGAAPSAFRARRPLGGLGDGPRIAAPARLSVRRSRRRSVRSRTGVALRRGRPIGCRAHGARRARRGRERKRTVRQMVVVGRASPRAIGIALGLAIDWFPPAASTQAEQDRHALGRAADRLGADLRARRDGRPASAVLRVPHAPGRGDLDGPPIHGNTRLEVIWTAIPAIIIVGLVRLRVRRAARHREGAGAPATRVVNVTGQQFAWTFDYQRGRQEDRHRRSSTCPTGKR